METLKELQERLDNLPDSNEELELIQMWLDCARYDSDDEARELALGRSTFLLREYEENMQKELEKNKPKENLKEVWFVRTLDGEFINDPKNHLIAYKTYDEANEMCRTILRLLNKECYSFPVKVGE